MYTPKKKTNTFPLAHIWVGLFALILTISAIGFGGTPVLADPETEESADALLVPTQQQGGRSWRNPFSGRTRRLRRTFAIPQGGGGGTDPLDECVTSTMPTSGDYLVEEFSNRIVKLDRRPNDNYFLYYPKDRIVILDHPKDEVEIMLRKCGELEVTDLYISSPSGKTISPVENWINYAFDLPASSELGTYELTILSAGYEEALNIDFEVVSPQDHRDLDNVPFLRNYGTGSTSQRGQTLTVEYVGFDAGTDIEVGIYRTEDNQDIIVAAEVPVKLGTLLEAWEFTTDSPGVQVQNIEIPLDAPDGIYYLVACAIDDCEITLVEGKGTFWRGISYVQEPELAWVTFVVGSEEVEDEPGEDVSTAWKGNLLGQNKSGEELYTVKPGDTLSQIARDNNTTVEALVDLNNIRNRHRIPVGLTLRLP